MTRMTFLHDLWVDCLNQPPSKENNLKLRHLEMLMDETVSDDDAQIIRKFVGDTIALDYSSNTCVSIVMQTASGPFRFDMDEGSEAQIFFRSSYLTEGAVRKKWEVSSRIILSVQQTKVLDAQWFAPWDGKIGPWKTTKSYRGKEFHYRVINPWLQLAEFVEYIELRRLIQDRFIVYHGIAASAGMDDLTMAPTERDDTKDPPWLSAARFAFKDKVEQTRTHYQYCSKREAVAHISRIVSDTPDGTTVI